MANTHGDLCISSKAQKLQLKIIRHHSLPKYQPTLERLVMLSAGELALLLTLLGLWIGTSLKRNLAFISMYCMGVYFGSVIASLWMCNTEIGQVLTFQHTRLQIQYLLVTVYTEWSILHVHNDVEPLTVKMEAECEAHACNPSIREVEAGELQVGPWPGWATQEDSASQNKTYLLIKRW